MQDVSKENKSSISSSTYVRMYDNVKFFVPFFQIDRHYVSLYYCHEVALQLKSRLTNPLFLHKQII